MSGLTVVGTGIKLVSQVTVEASAHIKSADKIFYHLPGDLDRQWILQQRPDAESLQSEYKPGKRRLDSYEAMVKRIVTAVFANQKVCAVFYGHPGVFVLPAHEAIKQVRAAGYDAHMLPGISAEDCLYADLGFDPAVSGCQTFEATDFLLYQRPFSAHSHLILWQIGVLGELRKREENGRLQPHQHAINILVQKLLQQYPHDHHVTIYEAAQLPIQVPKIESVPLEKLNQANITPISTLYVPPFGDAKIDEEMFIKLRMKREDLLKQW
ncbi:MAG: hypothetical protein GY943_03460 [Chloroflexi bacterium]|nr:hypothetical protein [Chloroflexota bacterium]